MRHDRTKAILCAACVALAVAVQPCSGAPASGAGPNLQPGKPDNEVRESTEHAARLTRHTDSASYLIGPEDAVAIHVVNHAEFSGAALVRPDGRLSVPGLGEVPAAGKSVAALQAVIAERLRRWIREPIVTVSVTQFRSLGQVFVLGRVTRGGAFPYRPGLTVTEALALAGGPADDADLRKATVFRADGSGSQVQIDLSPLTQDGAPVPRLVLHSGDMVVLPQRAAKRVSVVGDVQKPGQYDVSEKATLLELIQLAHGPRPSANLKGATLTRAGVTTPLDLEALLRRGDTAANLPLKDGDSIFVPENRIRVYVIGEVAKPDVFYLPDGATLLDALTAAGGHTRDADLRQVRLGRTDSRGATEVQTLDLNRMVARQKPLPPPPLKEGDLLFVPSKTRKKGVTDYIPFLYPIELLARVLGG